MIVVEFTQPASAATATASAVTAAAAVATVVAATSASGLRSAADSSTVAETVDSSDPGPCRFAFACLVKRYAPAKLLRFFPLKFEVLSSAEWLNQRSG